MRGLKKFGPDRLSRFGVYWMETNKQTKQTNKQTNKLYIYRKSSHLVMWPTTGEIREGAAVLCPEKAGSRHFKSVN